MKFILQPWHLMLIILASWVNRQQQAVIEYPRTENAVLKEKLGKKRILLTDDQRRRLAVKGKIVGRKQLAQVGTLFTPDTILRWHRQLVAKKWDYSNRKEQKPGRPRTRQVIVDLTLQFAKENPTWCTVSFTEEGDAHATCSRDAVVVCNSRVNPSARSRSRSLGCRRLMPPNSHRGPKLS
jgi:hypothetical protein